MSKAYMRFEDITNLCDGILSDINISDKKDYILRSVIVFVVAAMERYFKDRFLELFIAVCGKDNFASKACSELLEKSGVTKDFWRSHALHRVSNRQMSKILYNKVRDYLMKATVIQSQQAISNLYKYIGMQNIIMNAAGKSRKKNIWISIEDLLRRRHQIVHHADYRIEGGLNRISEMAVKKKLLVVREFIECVDYVLDCRFVNAKKDKVKMKNVSIQSPESFLKKGLLDAREFSAVARISDIGKIFRVNIPRKGFLFPGGVNFNYQSFTGIWWPKISNKPNHAGWKNEVVYDKDGLVSQILERNVKESQRNTVNNVLDVHGESHQIVFGMFEGETCSTGYCYRFIGSFELDIEESRRRNMRVWNRKETRIDLSK